MALQKEFNIATKLNISCMYIHVESIFMCYTHNRPTTESFILPKIHVQQTSSEMPIVAAMRVKPDASFCFSRKELQALTCFKDSETADQIIQWLELQGKLK